MWTDIANKEVNSSSFQFNFRVDPMILSAEWLWFLCIVLVFSSHLFLYHANFSAINLICNEHQQWNNRGQYIYQWVSVCCYSCCILISIFQEQSLIPFSSCWTQKYLNNFREGIFMFWEPSLCVDGALQRKAPNQCIPRICKATRTVYLTLLLWCSEGYSYLQLFLFCSLETPCCIAHLNCPCNWRIFLLFGTLSFLFLLLPKLECFKR